MRRIYILAIFMIPGIAMGQVSIPIIIGQVQPMTRPGMDATGSSVVFGTTVATDGSRSQTLDIYVAGTDGNGLRALTKFQAKPSVSIGPNSVAFQSDGKRAAYTTLGSTALVPSPGPSEEVHVVDATTGADRVVAVDTEGCILPLAAVCFGCTFSCVNEPHFSADGGKILYTVRRNQPFVIANTDGTGVSKLPVYSGAIAASPQRVMSRNGLVTFTSSAPFGPTFASAPTDVYVMNLDGIGIRNVSRSGADPSVLSANATISADGSTIAYERYDIGSAASVTAASPQIWVARVDGTGARPLTRAEVPSVQPSISGNGSVVAFVRSGQIGVSIVSPAGASEKIVTNFQTSVARDPVITEDGTRIAFALGPGDGGIGALYSVNSDGTNLHSIFAPRSANTNGVVGMNFSSPSPGSLFSLYGLNLAPEGITAATTFPLPTTLGGVSLFANDIPVPLLSAMPWQVNAQLPVEINHGTVAIKVRFADGAQNQVYAEIKDVSPAIFLVPDQPSPALSPGSGTVVAVAQAVAAAFHAQSSQPITSENPAVAGEIIEVYGTGLGLTTPIVPAGQPAPSLPPARAVESVQVAIGGVRAQVFFSGLTPGLAGVYQVNCVVPAGLRSGMQSMTWGFDSNNPSSFAPIPIR